MLRLNMKKILLVYLSFSPCEFKVLQPKIEDSFYWAGLQPGLKSNSFIVFGVNFCGEANKNHDKSLTVFAL